MNVVRLNMSHGDHESHKKVVDLAKEYNKLGRRTLAIMLDTKGPEVRSGDLLEPLELKTGAHMSTDMSAYHCVCTFSPQRSVFLIRLLQEREILCNQHMLPIVGQLGP